MRFIRDGELRTATSTFQQLLSYDEVLVVTYVYVGPGGRMEGGGGGEYEDAVCTRTVHIAHFSGDGSTTASCMARPAASRVVTPSRSDGELGTVEDCTFC